MPNPKIANISPGAGVEGGEVIIECSDFTFSRYEQVQVKFGMTVSRPVGVTPARVIAPVPANAVFEGSETTVTIATDDQVSNAYPFIAGQKIAENLHPVANPAYDRDSGAIYTTLSGTRGQKVDVSVYKITADGESEPFVTDLMNPTGLAFEPEGELFVTSRYDSSVYRITPFKEAEEFAHDLGMATGIAFDAEGKMYVGDRNGTIYLVDSLGDATTFATLEPSVSAYHLAFGPDGYLYVTGPTLSTFDSIMRISRDGVVSRFFTGLGRPQGLAFDRQGNLYVAASRHGHRGIIKITPDAEAEVFVAGVALVGLCFDDKGNMIIASNRELFRIPLNIEGYWPF